MPKQSKANTHEIQITRIGYGTKTVSIEAATRAEAVQEALDHAGNHEFSEHASDYGVFGDTTEKGVRILNQPLSRKEIEMAINANKNVEGVISVDLKDIINRDHEEFLDMISEKLVGSELLMDSCYRIVGHEGKAILLEVKGDASEAVNFAKDAE